MSDRAARVRRRPPRLSFFQHSMTDPQASPRHPASTARPHWGAEALWQALVPLLPGLSIEVVQTLDSTNSELTDRLRSAARVQQATAAAAGVDDLFPQLLVAIDQTAGRGRLGRRWHSTAGSSLTFSLALPLQPRRLVGAVAGGRAGRGRGAGSGRPAPGPEVAQRPDSVRSWWRSAQDKRVRARAASSAAS